MIATEQGREKSHAVYYPHAVYLNLVFRRRKERRENNIHSEWIEIFHEWYKFFKCLRTENISNGIYKAFEIDIEMWHFYSGDQRFRCLILRQNIFLPAPSPSFVCASARTSMACPPGVLGGIQRKSQIWNVQCGPKCNSIRWLNEWLVFKYELICRLVMLYFYSPNSNAHRNAVNCSVEIGVDNPRVLFECSTHFLLSMWARVYATF